MRSMLIATLEELILDTDSSDSQLYARIYNALGDCYRAANQPTDAALAYLHVDTLFNRESASHAEALGPSAVLQKACAPLLSGH